MAPPTRWHWFVVHRTGNVTVVRFTEPRLLDEAVVRAVGDQLRLLVGGAGGDWLLNFGAVSLVPSLMLAKLVALYKQVTQAGGRLALCELDPVLAGVLERTRLDRILPVVASEEEALAAFGARGR